MHRCLVLILCVNGALQIVSDADDADDDDDDDDYIRDHLLYVWIKCTQIGLLQATEEVSCIFISDSLHSILFSPPSMLVVAIFELFQK